MAEMVLTKGMPIADVVKSHPETVPVFMQHGLHCIGCALAAFESIAEGAAAHGIDVEALMSDLNKATQAEQVD